MSKPSPPAAPDPTTTIAAQTAGNKETAVANAELNRVNQYTPYGSSTYSVNSTNADGTPQYTQNVNLSPDQQQLFDMTTQGEKTLGNTALGTLNNLQSNFSKPFSLGGIAANTDFSGQMKQAQDAAYNTQTNYLDPQYKNAQSDLDAKLAGQGLQVGDEAYSRGQNDLATQKNQAYQGARDSAVTAGNNEQNTLYNQGLQDTSRQLALYNQPLNTYNALATGAQATTPTFGSVPNTQQANTDVAGITNSAYQNQLARFNASQSGINNLFSLGGSLGAAAILA